MKQSILLLAALLVSTPAMHGMRHVVTNTALKRTITHQTARQLVVRSSTQSSSASHEQKKELAKKLIELKKAEVQLKDNNSQRLIQSLSPAALALGSYTLLNYVIPKTMEYADVLACSGGLISGIALSVCNVCIATAIQKNYEKAYDDFVSCAFETNQEHFIAKEKEDL
jgi:hypothetical protein